MGTFHACANSAYQAAFPSPRSLGTRLVTPLHPFTVEEVIKDQTSFIYRHLCSEGEHLRVPFRHWHKLCSIVTLYMKYYHHIYCSLRARGDKNQISDKAIIRQRQVSSDSAISFKKWLTTICVVTRRDCSSCIDSDLDVYLAPALIDLCTGA